MVPPRVPPIVRTCATALPFSASRCVSAVITAWGSHREYAAAVPFPATRGVSTVLTLWSLSSAFAEDTLLRSHTSLKTTGWKGRFTGVV